MQTSVFDLFRASLALVGGGLIGYAFGLLQAAARRRHEERERRGVVKDGWSLMPGAGARIGYFLLALVLVQLVCPPLFADGTQWFVSGGVAAGYGWTLFRQLRQRIAASRG